MNKTVKTFENIGYTTKITVLHNDRIRIEQIDKLTLKSTKVNLYSSELNYLKLFNIKESKYEQ